MLKELRIQNFKGWKDTGTIRLAPISLFFGANSSGKSSIGQFLIMLKQTVNQRIGKPSFTRAGRTQLFSLAPIKKWFSIVTPRTRSLSITDGH